MRAILLAAGEGKRMRPLTLAKPKPMIEVLGKPLLAHILEALPEEITEVILVVGYKKEVIEAYFKDEYAGRRIRYVHQKKVEGTAHALGLCKEFIQDGERFLFLFADDLHGKDALKRMIRHPLAMMAHPHSDPSRFGVVEIDKKGKVVSFEEKPKKPKSHLVSPGVFVLDNRIFNYPATRHENGEYYLTDQVAQMMRDADFIVEKTDFWHPIGYPHDISSAEAILRGKGRPEAKTTPIIFLAGGRGTRMPEDEKHLPKVLVSVAGKPMLQHQIENAMEQGFSNIIISLGYKAEEIIAWLTKKDFKNLKWVVEKEPLGTGGGIKLASQGINEPFVVVNVDNLADFNFASMLRHSADGKFAVLAGVELKDERARDFGLLECDEHQKICSFKEKNAETKGGIISAGCYVLRPKDLIDMPDAFSIEKDLFPKLASSGELVLLQHKGAYWFDCGTSERLSSVRTYFENKGKS